MTTRSLGLRLAGVLLLTALAACSRDERTRSTERRGVEAFHSIELRGTGTLDVLVGEQQSLVVEADSESLKHLHTEVRNQRLVIESRGGWFWENAGGQLRIRVTLPQLNALDMNGAGRISVNGLAGGALALVLSGAGELEASGRVETLTARVNGAGSIDLSRLQATDATVAVNGAGSLQVNATGQLDAVLNGVGSITYDGKPTKLNSSINGVGSIRPR
jgi:hypothetical protein